MQKVVIDSDILIDHLRLTSQIFDSILEGVKNKKIKVYLPGIVVSEIYSGNDTRESDKLVKINDLVELFEFVPASQEVSRTAGFLVRDYKSGIGDAIVAATALSLNAKLATRNKKDFEGIKDLKFFRIPHS